MKFSARMRGIYSSVIVNSAIQTLLTKICRRALRQVHEFAQSMTQ